MMEVLLPPPLEGAIVASIERATPMHIEQMIGWVVVRTYSYIE
jgi:hypothetical protein